RSVGGFRPALDGHLEELFADAATKPWILRGRVGRLAQEAQIATLGVGEAQGRLHVFPSARAALDGGQRLQDLVVVLVEGKRPLERRLRELRVAADVDVEPSDAPPESARHVPGNFFPRPKSARQRSG